MRKILSAAILAAAFCLPALAENSGMATVGDITIHDAWARASLGKTPNSAAYFRMETKGDEADRLIAASSDMAGTVGLHTHLMEDGVAKMRPVEAIEVAPGEPTVLEPGGLHLMLMGVKEKLVEGGSLPLTLVFEKAGEIRLEIPVRAARAADAGPQRKMKHGDPATN